MSLGTSSIPKVDRPDIVKGEAKSLLSFKEVRDTLFKFMMQAEIPFTETERLPITTFFTFKEKTGEYVNKEDSRGRTRRVQKTLTHEVPLNNHSFYRITCKLTNLTVDGRPVYVLAVPSKFEELSNTQKNRIKTLQKQYHIIVFDEHDWKKLKLDISDKNWLKPLTRGIMKSWARILFKKISHLGENINSTYTLNDLFSNIDKNTSIQKNNLTITEALEQELRDLKKFTIKRLLSSELGTDVSNTQEKILNKLLALDTSSIKWIEDVSTSIIRDCLTKLNLKESKYKDKFRQSNGKINFINSEVFGEIVYKYLFNKKSLLVTNIGYGILKIQNKSTFQVLYIALVPTSSKVLKELRISKSIQGIPNSSLVLGLELRCENKNISKLSDIKGFLVLTSNCNKSYTYSASYRLPIIVNKKPYKCDLWSKVC